MTPEEALKSLARMQDGRNLDPFHIAVSLDANHLHERLESARISQGIWSRRAETTVDTGNYPEALKYREYWSLFVALYEIIILREGVLLNGPLPLPLDGLYEYETVMDWIKSL